MLMLVLKTPPHEGIVTIWYARDTLLLLLLVNQRGLIKGLLRQPLLTDEGVVVTGKHEESSRRIESGRGDVRWSETKGSLVDRWEPETLVGQAEGGPS